jgi:hypothetical protein
MIDFSLMFLLNLLLLFNPAIGSRFSIVYSCAENLFLGGFSIKAAFKAFPLAHFKKHLNSPDNESALANTLQKTINVKDYGALGNGISDDRLAFIQAIKDLKNQGGGVIIVPSGTYAISGGIALNDNIWLQGENGSTIIAIHKTDYVIRAMGDGIKLFNLGIDSNNLSKYGFVSYGFKDIKLEGNHFINWAYAIAIHSTLDHAALDIQIQNNRVDNPGSHAVFPILIASTIKGKSPKGVKVIGNIVIGSPGSYRPTNKHTADQIVLQGVDGFVVKNNTSLYGGENGMTVA